MEKILDVTIDSWYTKSMMGYGYGGGMMGGGMGFGFITWLVVMIDLVLLGIWLYKKIYNK